MLLPMIAIFKGCVAGSAEAGLAEAGLAEAGRPARAVRAWHDMILGAPLGPNVARGRTRTVGWLWVRRGLADLLFCGGWAEQAAPFERPHLRGLRR